MPTPFTPAADATWQTLLDELTLAYSERRQSIGQAAYTPADGRDVQAASYWTVIQQWIETNCISFIDHVNGPLNVAGNGFRYWTFEALLSHIGIAGDGFRRATAWDGSTEPAWSYGQMQSGDIIGPWIFEDLQKAFAALAKTLHAEFSAASYRLKFGSVSHAEWNVAKAAANSAYLAASASVNSGFYCSAFSGGSLSGGVYSAHLYNFQLSLTLSGIATFLPRAASFYAMVGPVGGGVFDANGLPNMDEDRVSLLGAVPVTSDEPIVSDYVGIPLDQLPNWDTTPAVTRGFRTPVGFAGAIIEWQFTNNEAPP